MVAKGTDKIKILLILLSIFAAVKMLFFAYGLDEEYQLVMSYRHAAGDRLFYNMWEPHQSSAFLCSLFLVPYLKLVGTTGSVLYLRAVGTMIHLLISIYFYCVSKKLITKEQSFYLALIYFNTIPKQIMMPEFGIMQVWFFTIMMLSLLQYYQNGKSLTYLAITSGAMVLEVLSYPSCMILFFFLVGILYINSENSKWRDIGFVTGFCGIGAVVYLWKLLQGRDLQQLLQTLSKVVSGDITHKASVVTKGMSMALGICYLAILVLIIWALAELMCQSLEKRGKGNRTISKADRKALWMVFFSAILQLCYWVVWNKGYESMQIHLVTLTIVGIFWSKKYRKNHPSIEDRLLMQGIVGAGISLLAVIYLTDLTIIESLAHASTAPFFAIMIWLRYQNSRKSESSENSGMVYLLLVIWCVTAVLGKGYSLRSGTDYNNVLETRGILKYGPAIGTVSNYMGAYVYNCDYEDWQEYVEDGDRVMIVVDQVMNLGTTQYLFKDVTISHYSIVNPTAYDKRLLEYWELFPERAPNVIIVDCWYGQLMTNPESYIMKYIENDFGYEQVHDGRYIRIYRK